MTTFEPKKTVKVTAEPEDPDNPEKGLVEQMKKALDKRNHAEKQDEEEEDD